MSTNRSVHSHGRYPGQAPGQSPSSAELVQFTYQLAVYMEKIDQQLTRLEQHFNLRDETPQVYPESSIGHFDEQVDDDLSDFHQPTEEHQAYDSLEPVLRKREPWLWVGGETKPYKEVLKAEGGRWSRRHQKWYFINRDSIPASLLDLPGINWEITN